MKMAVEEINAAGGIQGRKIKMVLEDSGYDPKRAVLASQKMVERDKVFAMVGPMGSPTVLASQDVLFDAAVLQLFPLTAAEFTCKFDPAKPQERLKFNNLLPYVESTRAAVKYMIEGKNFKKPCIMHQDDEYGKNVLDGFTQQVSAMKLTPASVTSYKRGASDFSAQIAKMKSDTDANTQAIIGYNAMMTFAFYANKAGKDLTGQKMMDALESGDKFLDIFNSPPTKFSKTDHLANTITQVQQIKNGRWVLVKAGLMF